MSRYTPGPGCTERYDFRPTEAEVAEVLELFKYDLEIPYNFEQTVLAYKPNGTRINMAKVGFINQRNKGFRIRENSKV